jgi:N-acetylglucosamine-6-phosphate deacetylase
MPFLRSTNFSIEKVMSLDNLILKYNHNKSRRILSVHCAVLIEDGMIADVFSERRFEQKHFGAGTEIINVERAFVSPGFIDTHIHGFGGFGTEDSGSAESVPEMSKAGKSGTLGIYLSYNEIGPERKTGIDAET